MDQPSEMNIIHIQSEPFPPTPLKQMFLQIAPVCFGALEGHACTFSATRDTQRWLRSETLSVPRPTKSRWFVDVSNVLDIVWFYTSCQGCTQQ